MQFSKWVTLSFGAVCLIAVAGMLNAPHLYYMAAILLTLPGISYLLGWHTLQGLVFSREPQDVFWEGEEGEIIYIVRNRSPIARFFISIQEHFPPWIEPIDPEPPLFNVAARDSTRVIYRVRFLRRGVYQAVGFDVVGMDPLGVFAFTRRIQCDHEIIAYPMPGADSLIELTGSEHYSWQEFIAAATRGSSVDPDGVRAYSPGDPLRHIHWRQTARTGRLSVIEFEEAQSVNLVIVLDLHKGTEIGSGVDTTLEYAVRLTTSVAHRAIQEGASVRLIASSEPALGGSRTHTETAGRGQDHLYTVLDRLARVEATSDQKVSAVVSGTVGPLLPGTSLLIVTSQADLDLPSAIIRYVSTGARVSVAFIDPESFEASRMHKASSTPFLGELLASGANTFVIRRQPNQRIEPERAE